jgi:hypothetical protein
MTSEIETLIEWVKDGKRDYELTWLFSKTAELSKAVQARQSALNIQGRVTDFLNAPFDSAQYGPLLYDAQRLRRADLAESLTQAFDLNLAAVRDADDKAFYRNLITEEDAYLAELEETMQDATQLEDSKRKRVGIDLFKKTSKFLEELEAKTRLLDDLDVFQEFERIKSRAGALKMKIGVEVFNIDPAALQP